MIKSKEIPSTKKIKQKLNYPHVCVRYEWKKGKVPSIRLFMKSRLWFQLGCFLLLHIVSKIGGPPSLLQINRRALQIAGSRSKC